MKRLTYGVLSSLLVLVATVSVKAETPTSSPTQSNATIQQMFREQRVISDEMKAMMAEMKTMMAEIKALTSLPEGQTPTTTDLYKQQQILRTQMETLLSQTKLERIQYPGNVVTVQGIHQQQVVMMADMKVMMADMKKMLEVYRGRAGSRK